MSAEQVQAPLAQPQSVAARQPPRYADLLLLLVGGVILGWLVTLPILFPLASTNPLSWFVLAGRLLLGLPFVLYVPGHLLQAVLFPHHADLDSIERIGLSLGLSVALITLLALLLNALPWGLTAAAILVGQAGMIVILMLVTALLRHYLPSQQVYVPDVRPHLGRWWSGLARVEQRLLVVMGAVLFIALLTAAWIFLVPSDNAFMTEFYMLGPQGLAENFPRQASLGQPLTLTLGLTNRERTSMDYRLEVWQVDPLDETHRQLVASAPSFTLPVGQTRQWDQSFQPAWAGQDQQFVFFLYTPGQPDPYRQLLLWMNIDP